MKNYNSTFQEQATHWTKLDCIIFSLIYPEYGISINKINIYTTLKWHAGCPVSKAVGAGTNPAGTPPPTPLFI